MAVDFCHLHAHTEYSLLDGASRIKDLVKRAQQLGQKAVAITDHGNMFGVIEFYNTCKEATKKAEAEGKQGIKPILGMEAYIVPGGESRAKREKIEGQYDHHCLLWATDRTGYKNLMKLSSKAYAEGFYMHPRIDLEILAEHAKGLIASTGCLGSEIPQAFVNKDYDAAKKLAGRYMEIVGKDNFYFELQNQVSAVPIERRNEDAIELLRLQTIVNTNIVKLAKEMGGKLIATNDSHYTSRDDAEAHDALLCIGTGKLLSDTNRLKFACEEFYLKSTEEMHQLFRDYPEALNNTLEIADRCDVEIEFGKYHLPAFPIPGNKEPNEFFKKKVYEGVKGRYGVSLPQIVKERTEEELRVLIKMGFVGYLLIVWDIIREARAMGIAVGPGRGSAAGSIVCYGLGITDVDPLKYNLLFERFVNEGRNEMPDIDIDFCQSRRPEIIEYVQEKYGRDCTAGIITFNTMAAKGSIRDLGRVMDYPLAEVDSIAKMIPTAPKVTLQPRTEDSSAVHAVDDEPDFKAQYQKDPRTRTLVDMARRIEGITRNPGRHAAGLVISDKDITEYLPLYRDKDGALLTQYEMNHIDAVGLLKVDFLGLETLTVLYLAVDLIEERHGIKIDLNAIPIDDQKSYRMLGRGEAKGIFQFESDGMVKLLMEARPDCLEDLIALNAMFRPGPMQNIPTFVNRKHGREPIDYLIPELEPILKDTYGIIVYQEQVMQIANQLGGFSLSDADRLRKAMGKKKKDLMTKYGVQFVQGCAERKIDPQKAEELYALIAKFAEYGFNKSHAAAYAFLAYQTAYLKANYPAEFMAALLTLERGTTDKVVEYIEESRRINLEIAGPDINKSGSRFGIEEDGRVLRFALGAIKGVGEKAVENIVEARTKDGPFRDLFEFCERIDARSVNKGCIESLTRAGAFDSVAGEGGRAQIVAGIEDAMSSGASLRRDRESGQGSLFGELAQDDEPEVALPNVPEWPESIRLEEEKKVLGFYFSGHPMADVRELVEGLSSKSCKGLAQVKDGLEVVLGAYVNTVEHKITRKDGRKMAVLNIEDFSGTAQAVIFPNAYDKFKHLIEPDKVLFFRGKLQNNEGGGNALSVLADEIFTLDAAIEKYLSNISITIKEINSSSSSQTLAAVTDGKGIGKKTKGKSTSRKNGKEASTSGNGKRGPEDIVSQVKALSELLQTHPGRIPVYFRLELEEGEGPPATVIMKTGGSFGVRPTCDLFAGLHEMFPPGAVHVTAEGNKPRMPAPRWGRPQAANSR